MTSHQIDWRARAVAPDEVTRHIGSGHRVFVHGTSATPTPLLEALSRRTDLEGVRLYHLHLDGPVPTADAAHNGRIRHVALFLSPQLRDAVAEYGVAYLHGLTLRERGEALVAIAHPDMRGELTRALRQIRHFSA